MLVRDAWVDEVLAVLAEDEPALARGELRHRVVLWPTFHPEAVISARFGERASLRVAAMAMPAFVVELEATRAAALRGVLEACVIGLADHDERIGRDGVTVAHEVEVGGGAASRALGWSPEPGQLRHRHVAALFVAACECFGDAQVQRTLAKLRGYLELDGPLYDHGGAPRRLEIRGRLSVFHHDSLAGFLARVRADEAVVVDARGLVEVAARVLPLLRRFARRTGPLAWVVSPAARELLHAARVPRGRMFVELAAALRSLGGA